MKKLIAIALILAAVFALCACGQPVTVEKEVVKEVEKTVEVPVVPEEYKKYQSLIDALEAGDFDSATEIFEGLKPVPEVPPMKEVTITKDNFLDYFEYQQFPTTNLDFMRTSAGQITAVIAQSGFYLKEGYRIAHEKAAECKVEAGVKYQDSLFYAGNKGINVDPANCRYEITLKANDVVDRDEMLEGSFHTYPDGTEIYTLWFGYNAVLSKEKDGLTQIIEPDGVELVSASGTLYLYE